MKYNEEARDRAFLKYLETGNVATTSVICGLARDTVRKWSHQENWQSKLQKHRKRKRQEILKALYKIQMAQLKEFVIEISKSHRFSTELIRTAAIDGGKKLSRANYGSYGLQFNGEELSISWFTQRLRRDPDHTLDMENGQEIEFTSTPCYFGGFRWWIICPECNRRCEKLYKRKSQYGCRICLQLKYKVSTM